jgi:hypothetical protein
MNLFFSIVESMVKCPALVHFFFLLAFAFFSLGAPPPLSFFLYSYAQTPTEHKLVFSSVKSYTPDTAQTSLLL